MGSPAPVPLDPLLPPPVALLRNAPLAPLLDDGQRDAIREIVCDMLIASAWNEDRREEALTGGGHG